MMAVRSLMKRARLLMSHGSTDVAMSLVEQGIGLVAGDSEAEQVLRGYGLLRGAIVAARNCNLDLAQTFIEEACFVAQPMRHESDLYTTDFGPGNVEIHACAVELEAGDPGRRHATVPRSFCRRTSRRRVLVTIGRTTPARGSLPDNPTARSRR